MLVMASASSASIETAGLSKSSQRCAKVPVPYMPVPSPLIVSQALHAQVSFCCACQAKCFLRPASNWLSMPGFTLTK
jgi:hypothetical protein